MIDKNGGPFLVYEKNEFDDHARFSKIVAEINVNDLAELVGDFSDFRVISAQTLELVLAGWTHGEGLVGPEKLNLIDIEDEPWHPIFDYHDLIEFRRARERAMIDEAAGSVEKSDSKTKGRL